MDADVEIAYDYRIYNFDCLRRERWTSLYQAIATANPIPEKWFDELELGPRQQAIARRDQLIQAETDKRIEEAWKQSAEQIARRGRAIEKFLIPAIFPVIFVLFIVTDTAYSIAMKNVVLPPGLAMSVLTMANHLIRQPEIQIAAVYATLGQIGMLACKYLMPPDAMLPEIYNKASGKIDRHIELAQQRKLRLTFG